MMTKASWYLELLLPSKSLLLFQQLLLFQPLLLLLHFHHLLECRGMARRLRRRWAATRSAQGRIRPLDGYHGDTTDHDHVRDRDESMLTDYLGSIDRIQGFQA